MTAFEVIGLLVALPLFVAAYADWQAEREQLRHGTVAVMRSLPLRRNTRR